MREQDGQTTRRSANDKAGEAKTGDAVAGRPGYSADRQVQLRGHFEVGEGIVL
jgi:hypothetical protein